MRYNTYRKYKTLNGYDDRRDKITSVIHYVEKNYQFQWQSYDIFRSLTTEDFNNYVKGKNIRFIIDKYNRIVEIGVYSNHSSTTKLYDLPFEPNSFIFNFAFNDVPDHDREIWVSALTERGSANYLFATPGSNNPPPSTAIGSSIAPDQLSWSFLEAEENEEYLYENILCLNVWIQYGNDHENVSQVQSYYAPDSEYLRVEMQINSSDTQSNINTYIAYVPTFVPVE